ncbi:hypothetical protein SLS53_006380 [Cytospora paraplurivora]|uniref:Cell division cycle protein 123 n=1 Tax=Cytospora paraplurivora TaxID=2898453 RepID=A0AAN9U2D3_9PEZI
MPAFENPEQRPTDNNTAAADSNIAFPPVTRDHILHCSYDYWFPKTSCIKSRIIKLSPAFIEYIREDGIILSSDDPSTGGDDDDDWEPTSTAYSRPTPEESEADSDEDDEADASSSRLPPDQRFPEIHQTIKDTIKELGGEVAPKLNWSSPKDAAWISAHQNTVKCTTPNDIYLLLKSSNFITHDLDHAFDGTVTTSSSFNNTSSTSSNSDLGFQPVLVLRSFFTPHQALEFRCFVKQRSLVAIAQRDLNHYNFLQRLRPAIIARVKDLFDSKLRFTFPDGNFCFDVYIPEVHNLDSDSDDSEDEDPAKSLGRARLIDINPWAPRTDTVLFDWSELLELNVPKPMIGVAGTGIESGVVRLHIGDGPHPSEDEATTEEDDDDEDYEPELRLVDKDDPSAYNFSSPQYSAHKLPKEVVDASLSGGGGLREFAEQWNDMLSRRR